MRGGGGQRKRGLCFHLIKKPRFLHLVSCSDSYTLFGSVFQNLTRFFKCISKSSPSSPRSKFLKYQMDLCLSTDFHTPNYEKSFSILARNCSFSDSACNRHFILSPPRVTVLREQKFDTVRHQREQKNVL
jgi:hypothetical protein